MLTNIFLLCQVRDNIQIYPEQLREVPFSEVEKCDILWTDTTRSESYDQLKSNQRINHFPRMHEIATKSSFAKLVNTHRSIFSQHFDFAPATWELPQDRIACEKAVRLATECPSPKTFILKPTSGLQGTTCFN